LIATNSTALLSVRDGLRDMSLSSRAWSKYAKLLMPQCSCMSLYTWRVAVRYGRSSWMLMTANWPTSLHAMRVVCAVIIKRWYQLSVDTHDRCKISI